MGLKGTTGMSYVGASYFPLLEFLGQFHWPLSQLSLVDFGATREYTKEFMDSWLSLLQAAASEDRIACAEWSRTLGYLTGEENEVPSPHHCSAQIFR